MSDIKSKMSGEDAKYVKKQPVFTRAVNILLVLITAANYIIYGDWLYLFSGSPELVNLVIGGSAVHVSVVYVQVWVSAFILTRAYSFVKNKFSRSKKELKTEETSTE